MNDCFAVPLSFHDDVANLDDAVLGEGIAKVLNGRRVQFVGFALRMLIVEAGKLGVVVANAVGRGFREASALGIILKHIGVKGILGSSLVLLATTHKEGQRGEA